MKFSLFRAALSALLISNVISSPTPTRKNTIERRVPAGFVSSSGTNWMLDGKKFDWAGTTAYWLTQLNSLSDIDATLADIASKGFKVVRIWGFRDVVGEAPSDPATYTSIWVNGKQQFNQPGLDRLKYILDAADKLGLKVILSFTNNWDVHPTNSSRPAGYYSNTFGGMDTYVAQIKKGGHHDDFYTCDDIIIQFKKWTTTLVSQFKDHKAVFSWELANDPRCKGADGTTTSKGCKPTTITKWTNDISTHVKSIDPNHMVNSGDSGFFCVDCPKINKPPVPQSLPSGGARAKRSRYLTKKDVLGFRTTERREVLKKAQRGAGKKFKVRGFWSAPEASTSFERVTRQDSSLGSNFDGSFGVDTEDIVSHPDINFSSFQFFPDQNTYSPNGQDSSPGPPKGGAGGANFDTTLQSGVNWIQSHASSSNSFGKPSQLTGFGLVSQDSSTNFNGFDSTNVGTPDNTTFATPEQQQQAYTTWTDTAIQSGVNGIVHYQWGKTGLTSKVGSVVDDTNTSGDSSDETHTQGASPNDGYGGVNAAIQNILSSAASAQNGKDSS